MGCIQVYGVESSILLSGLHAYMRLVCTCMNRTTRFRIGDELDFISVIPSIDFHRSSCLCTIQQPLH